MKMRRAKIAIHALLAALIVCAPAGILYGLARVALRHGPKLVSFVAERMPDFGWGGHPGGPGEMLRQAARLSGVILEQAFGLAAIAIFWIFLLSPLWIGRHNEPDPR